MEQILRRYFSLTRASWRETAVLMAVAWLVPLLVHLVPWAGPRPIGVYLLPAFWTALVAVYLYGARVGVVVALVTPAVNFFATGLPVSPHLGLTSLELAAFALLAAGAVRRWPTAWFIAPLAYVPAKALSVTVAWLVPVFADTRPPLVHLLASTQNALAGLAVMLGVNLALVKLLPKDRDRDRE